jgi:hypothetical protein
MATYNSDQYTAVNPIPSHGLAADVKGAYFSVTCAAAPATTDTINFGYLPAGARVLAAVLEATDMDTNGSPTITLNVGDSGSATRLFSASTVAQAGTLSSAIAVAGNAASYTTKTLITGVAQANAATGAAGTLYLTILYIVEGQAS